MELGLYTFADLDIDLPGGKNLLTRERYKNLLEEIRLADELGLDVFGIGEHHRPDYAVSSPTTVLGAAAMITSKIKLSSAVTVLSSDDPVRVFQQFATVDQLSGGRAEIMAGRGSFIESFPLFGYDLDQYDELFAEKLDLLLQINSNEIADWKGKLRPSISKLGVYPRPLQDKLPVWLAVGGTRSSAIRAARLKLPMALAIIGGSPEQFVPFIDLYKASWEQAGHSITDLRLGINSHVFVGETSQQAADSFYPGYAGMMQRIGRERGWSPMNRQQFEQMRSEKGSLLVGSPQQVIEKILYEHELFGNTRFLAQMSMGNVPHADVMRSIELFGAKVAPAIRKAVPAAV